MSYKPNTPTELDETIRSLQERRRVLFEQLTSSEKGFDECLVLLDDAIDALCFLANSKSRHSAWRRGRPVATDHDNVSEIGSEAWWQKTPMDGPHGVLDTILRLLEQEEITRAKAIELIEFSYGAYIAYEGAPEYPIAPWDKVNWGT